MKDSDFQLDVVAVRLVKDSPIYSSVKISDPKSIQDISVFKKRGWCGTCQC